MVIEDVSLEYDPEFGQGEHMFNDLALSREILSEFHDRVPETSSARKLSVMVLQQSVWPFAARKIDVDLHPFVCLLLLSSSFCAPDESHFRRCNLISCLTLLSTRLSIKVTDSSGTTPSLRQRSERGSALETRT